MRRVLWLTLVCVGALAATAWAGAPKEIDVQGLYQGTWKDAGKEGKLEARVVAMGDRTYKILAIQQVGAERKSVELDGKTVGDAVTFQGADWKGTYADAAVTGTIGAGGSFTVKRTDPTSPTLGKKPPEGAIVLLGGKPSETMNRGGGRKWYLGDMSKNGWPVWEVPIRWTTVAKDPAQWPSKEAAIPEGWELVAKERRVVDQVIGIGEDGSIQVPRGGMNSNAQIEGSFDAHVEFRCPFGAQGRGQGRGNSGVYLPCRQEIQVLDSFGMVTYKGGCCGGLYGMKNPDPMQAIESLKNQRDHEFTLASFPPMVWQTYDIEYRVREGAVFLTVHHNGIKIHDIIKLNRKPNKGGFHFQDHGNPVRYRNIWVKPVKDKADL